MFVEIISSIGTLVTTGLSIQAYKNKKPVTVKQKGIILPTIIEYDENKLKFLQRVNDYFDYCRNNPYGDQKLNDISYVRSSSMYSDAFGHKAFMKVGGNKITEPLGGNIVYRGTFDAMADWIIWAVYHNWNDVPKINYYAAKHIIETYVNAAGMENSLGRKGPTCAYLCSVLKGWNFEDLLKSVAAIIVIVGAVVASPVTGGASLLAIGPAGAELNAALK